MVKLIVLSLLFFLLDNSCQAHSESATVEIENGRLVGEERGNIFAFEGIPYAEAPVGQLRFEPPKPYSQKWTEPRNATKVGKHICRLF